MVPELAEGKKKAQPDTLSLTRIFFRGIQLNNKIFLKKIRMRLIWGVQPFFPSASSGTNTSNCF